MNNRIWNILPDAPKEFLTQFPEYPEIIAKLLYNRNIRTQKGIDEFFNPDYVADLHDPYLYKDMDNGVLCIKEAIDNKSKIAVYGDYDADGVSASVVLHAILKELGADFSVYIPDRYKDGYGLTEKSVKEFAGNGVRLIITVDCGITSIKEVALANQLGMKVVIVDHHITKDELPPAFAVIDAKRSDETYPFKWLCGGAMAFKLTQAILNIDKIGVNWPKAKQIKEGFEKWLLDVVALCTITDMVPLVGENRTLAKYGFLVMAQTRRKGLRELMRVSGLEPKITKLASTGELFSNIGSYEAGFVIGPRINAAGRIDHANIAFDLLITEDDEEAKRLAIHLDETNLQRQKMIEVMVKEVEERLMEKYKGNLPKIIFEGSDKWPSGIVGIIAGKLTEKYSRPAFIYSVEDSKNKGSCRSIKSFNLVEVMKNCADFLIDYGGHVLAAGFTVSNENLEKFRNCLVDQAEKLTEDDLRSVLNIDAKMEFNDVGWEIYDYLKNFEPFGQENAKPKFLSENLIIKSMRWVGNGEKHAQIKLTSNSKELKGIAFNFGDFKDRIKEGNKADVVFEIDVNEWNGNRELQLMIRDIKIL